ncbi:MAG: MBL fold metallo-hydrolase [Mogibacterium sp.]|nr:MBL fold metallo-hydrolase [Mogibacterium sp.]
MKIRFCGASTGVTGSCHLVMTEQRQILLDCGQFQGGKAQDALNYEPFPFEPSEVECLVLSHAHIDHCGRIPLLVKCGFTGNIYCTKATADLLPIMLRDSAYIHEKEAEWATKKAQRMGEPEVQPLYTLDDAERALKYITPVLYDQLIDINDEMRICFNDAGHILGSAMVELWVREGEDETKIVFSGDIGVKGRPILRDPTMISKADYVIMESTYGNRLHPANALSISRLVDVVLQTVHRGGTVVIPAFAVGRTQEILFEFNKLYDNNPKLYEQLKDVYVYVDSPMASAATEVFNANTAVFDEETLSYIARGDHPLEFANLRFTQSTEESQALNNNPEPKIIISASGMCEAGRIRHHLKHHLWNPKSSIIFVGYQAEGTLGRKILEGAESVNIFGEEILVQAEIVNLEGFSGHADRDGLAEWISNFKTEPQVFLVHGEDDAKRDFAAYVGEHYGVHAIVVEGNSEYELVPGRTASLEGQEDPNFDDSLSAEEVLALRNKMSTLSASISDLMTSAELATGKKLEDDELIRINNIIKQLEESEAELREALLHTNEAAGESDTPAEK